MERPQRPRAEREIRRLGESLCEGVEVEGAVARVGEELVEGIDRPGLLDRVCRFTTVALRSIGPMDPRRMLEEVREECHGLTAPNVEIVWRIPSELTAVRTDAAKVKATVKGLLQNAVKFAPYGRVTVEARDLQGGLDFSVTDTGIGIPLDSRSYIFEPFRQVEHTTPRRFGGVGLGLHLVRGLVDLLEGSITVESEVGRGSIFKVILHDIDDRRPEWNIGRI
jgi:signal transduction histidine kinase